MIEQITVQNYILFDKASVEFEDGMSVITGETGAGKSLLIDAIGYLCGGRIQGSIVRQGQDKAVLRMVLTSSPAADALLLEHGFEPEEVLTITRTVNAAGKSQVRLNGQITTLGFIRQLTARLIDIHSQLDTIQLMDPAVQLDLLDQYAGVDRQGVQDAWKEFASARQALQQAQNETYSDEELEFVTAQLNEIDSAKAGEGELEQLQESIRTASRSQKTEEEVREVLGLLKKDGGILESVYELARVMKKNPGLAGRSDEIQSLYYQLESVGEEAQEQLDSVRDQARDLDAMQDREYQLKRLYRKYGGSREAMMEKRQALETRVDRILHRQDLFDKLEKQKKAALAAYVEKARALSKAREAVIPELQEQILSHARDLMLEHARFEIRRTDKTPGETGMDDITFYASMNPGQPLTPVRQSASGGELSRLMLALKTVFQTREGIDTIIFDEIDTGVSGKVALAMGSKMHKIAENRQVLCITHLASVAVWADRHFTVSKESDGQTTLTRISELDHEETLRELAIMAHGHATEQAVDGMRELQKEVLDGQSPVSH
ncbi:DNA repair protein RecN [Faecalibaculum rodentium]|jgi:DNA repair protein RecN (Recombination protein N)|uniref:DNA repair protein RecN n=1 Tax=Faecalibaculum rodentium TaxID=1702221 RepID=UPI001C3E6ECE|nr:DNA repair protein RecN [Faecalibaculum rodentium]